MPHYLLSTHSSDTNETSEPSEATPNEMREMMERVVALEADMDATGTFVFGGHLHGPDASTVVRPNEAGTMLTDGPFIESKEHLAGFYIIDASDVDAALRWGERVATCVGRPIEVRPFGGTGRVADQSPG